MAYLHLRLLSSQPHTSEHLIRRLMRSRRCLTPQHSQLLLPQEKLIIFLVPFFPSHLSLLFSSLYLPIQSYTLVSFSLQTLLPELQFPLFPLYSLLEFSPDPLLVNLVHPRLFVLLDQWEQRGDQES